MLESSMIPKVTFLFFVFHTLCVLSVTLHINILFNLFQLWLCLFKLFLLTINMTWVPRKTRTPKNSPGDFDGNQSRSPCPNKLPDAVCSQQRGDQDCKARGATHDLCFHGEMWSPKIVLEHLNAGNMAHVYLYVFCMHQYYHHWQRMDENFKRITRVSFQSIEAYSIKTEEYRVKTA